MSFQLTAVALTTLLFCFADALASDRQSAGVAQTMPPVEVRTLRDPVDKSYRKIVRGMDLFERERALAPDAALRFKLLPRSRDTTMEGIALNIVGNTFSLPVAVAPDESFALPRVQRALDEDASVVPNRRARTMTWRADIRTPGLPPNVRRLGDLRLECRVGVEAELVSETRSLLDQLTRRLRDANYCEQLQPAYLFFAERPLWSVTLSHGNRREVLAIDQMYAGSSRQPLTRSDLRHCDCEVLLDRTYYAPLGDASWPDDTLLIFEYIGGGPREGAR